MAQKRQLESPQAHPVRSLAVDYPHGFGLAGHEHSWDQLVYASTGVMTVNAGGLWVVPSGRAVWVPGGVVHSIEMSGTVAMRTLYFAPGLVDRPSECAVIEVSALLRELVVHTCQIGMLDASVHEHACLLGVILSQLCDIESMPLRLPLPSDLRARAIADRLRSDPSEVATLTALASEAGASKRTLERLFRAQTGMTFGRWRQQLRLLHALRLLARGESVTRVALDSGYESTSAFIAMFKRALGTTPSRYYRRTP